SRNTIRRVTRCSTSGMRPATGRWQNLSMSSCQRWGVSAQFIQLRLFRLDELSKLGFESSFDRRCRFRLLFRLDRIDGRSVLGHHEMKMRPRCKTRLTDESDEFALLNRTARANSRSNARQVGIPAGQTAGMLDPNQIAVAFIPTCKCHHTVCNCD